MRKFLLVLGMFLLSGPVLAAGKVVADLSDDFVAVTEGFDGYRLTVFGALRGASDIALVVEGPKADALIRPKKKVMGIWVNGEPSLLEKVPAFYAVASSRPIEEMVSESMATKFKLGTHLVLPDTPEAKGFLEVKKEQALYQDLPRAVRILEWKLFRVDVQLPANVPIGEYKAHIYEFINGQFSASRTAPLKVGQVGVGERLNRMAHEKPFMYAFFALALSLGLGGSAAYLFRKVS